MGAHWLHNLPQVLGGLQNVSFYPGWETRSRSSGGYDAVQGIVVHHTASMAAPESDMRYQWVSASERPVGAIYLGRDGRIVVGAAGATNCQGRGGPLNTSKGNIPKDQGNRRMIAIEAANNGVGEAWPDIQQNQYVALVRALVQGYSFSPADAFGHFDYCAPSCPGRKIDPAGPSRFGAVNANQTWDINAFRGEVAGAPTTPPPVEPPPDGGSQDWITWVMNNQPVLRRGSSGIFVKRMQHLIASNGFMNEANTGNYDGIFGSGTEGALKKFQSAAGGTPDGVCGPWTWGALMHTIDGIPTIKKGSNGADVKRMQHLLAAGGFMQESNVANYDGAWGSGTDSAKVKFDNAHGLTPSPPTDCGAKSWESLLNGWKW